MSAAGQPPGPVQPPGPPAPRRPRGQRKRLPESRSSSPCVVPPVPPVDIAHSESTILTPDVSRETQADLPWDLNSPDTINSADSPEIGSHPSGSPEKVWTLEPTLGEGRTAPESPDPFAARLAARQTLLRSLLDRVVDDEPAATVAEVESEDTVTGAQSAALEVLGAAGLVMDLDDAAGLRKVLDRRRQTLFHRYFDEDGRLTSDGKEFLGRGKTTTVEQELKEELLFLTWSQFSGDDEAVNATMKATGLSRDKVESNIRRHMQRLLMEDGGAETMLAHKIELEKVRHRGRVHMIGRMQDIVAKALTILEMKLADAGPREAATIVGILTDKALLLSGQATSRVARMDERFMSDGELEAARIGKRAILSAMEAEEALLVPYMPLPPDPIVQ